MLPFYRLKEYIMYKYYIYRNSDTYDNIQYRRVNNVQISYLHKLIFNELIAFHICENKYRIGIEKILKPRWCQYKITIIINLPNYESRNEYYGNIVDSKYIWYDNYNDYECKIPSKLTNYYNLKN